MWQLTTFGGVSLRGEGAPPAVAAQRRPLALLALLAASGESGLSRDKIVVYLWPESDEERARNALRQLLHSLRHGLEEPELLLGTTDLRLNPRVIGSDVEEFEAALTGRDFGRAASVYRGPFLDGFHLSGAPEFQYWLDAQRAEYATRAGAALEAVAREADRRGEAETALTCWRRLSALDPLNSRIAVELMNALAGLGNPAGALQHARVHETLVREELGAAPDTAVAALADRLRTALAAPHPGPAAAHAARTSPLQAPALPVAETPDSGTEVSPQAAVAQSAALPTGILPGQLIKLRERLEAGLSDRFVIEHEQSRREGTTRVFVARDRKHDRPVALKVLHPALASSLDLQRFVREIAVTARLQHPHILPILESGEVGPQQWYATPRLEGESLRDRLIREPMLPPEVAIEITIDIGDGLAYAHRQGVIHRDVRPENVLLAEGHAFILNFGLASALMAAAGPKLTGTGMLVGTPAYMSPEQAQGTSVDGKSDVYSLGCVLYEMLAGEPPFTGPTSQAIMAKRAMAPAQPAMKLRPGIPEGLAMVLAGALATLPEDRPPAAELVQQLDHLSLMESQLQASAPASNSSPSPEQPRLKPAFRRHLWSAAAVVATLVLASLICARA